MIRPLSQAPGAGNKMPFCYVRGLFKLDVGTKGLSNLKSGANQKRFVDSKGLAV